MSEPIDDRPVLAVTLFGVSSERVNAALRLAEAHVEYAEANEAYLSHAASPGYKTEVLAAYRRREDAWDLFMKCFDEYRAVVAKEEAR